MPQLVKIAQRSWPLVICATLIVIGIALILIATGVVLSLIPLYLENHAQSVNNHFPQTRTIQVNYVMDSSIALDNVDKASLARQFETQMGTHSGFLTVSSVGGDRAIARRRRRAVQCKDSSLSGPTMQVIFVASNSPAAGTQGPSYFCFNAKCITAMFNQTQQRFAERTSFTVYVSYVLSTIASRTMRLRFCSMKVIGAETETPSGPFTTKQRAMVKVEAKSMVGILFDDIPTSIRTKAKALIDAKNDDYWRDLATQQMQYTQLRLIFRPTYYPKTQAPSKRGTLSLTLPKLFEFEFNTAPKFTTIDGHVLYVREYTFHNVLITDVESLAKADDRLANVTGSMSENFSLPIDPFLILQRTGFDCMSEGGWPPNSIDPETTEFFFDDTCDVETPQDPSLSGCQQAHCTYPLPNISCVESLKKNIGHIEVPMIFTRIADNATLADEWRYPAEGPSVNADGQVAPVNLVEDHEAFSQTRIVYLYVQPDGCEIVERCVGGSGWRRLLVFSTTTPNYGTEDLQLGSVSYFVNEEPSDFVNKYRIYEYSPCHKHFHFSHYGLFTFGKKDSVTNSKRGFCLQTTYRHANAEWSVMAQNHFLCSNQGIAPGWSDTYQGGIPCQWVDVTSYNTSTNTYTDELVSSLNPDNFLCEGVTQNETWIPTNFTTMCCSGSGCCGDTPMTNCCGGLPVSKQGCNTWKGATDDNLSTINVTLPLDGEGQLTANCASSSGTWGPQRDCGFRLHPQGKMLTCGLPGRNATVKSVTATSDYQVVRVCEASIVLNSCLACIWNASLASVIIEDGQPAKDIPFICTSPRDTQEVGGKFCVYVAPYFEEHEHNTDHVQWASTA